MRTYLSADMDGVTGLVDADDVQPGRPGLTVNDAHGPMRNLTPEALRPAWG